MLPYLSVGDLNDKDPDGKTALHWAVEMASVAAVQRLVAIKDVDSNIKDAKNRTPMDILTQAQPSGIIDRIKAALKGETLGA